ncbi:sigma-54 interaction domain-containing protein [Sporomusa aerivorans]|uniref:sigma-54 interaction domain-containing protein n=1 Tax=Sporomusa aerivorans TaxID=204936 RepID=UPI00352B7EF3
MQREFIKGPWGLIMPVDDLLSAIRFWGPKPFFLNIGAVCITGVRHNVITEEHVRSYFEAEVFSDVEQFCAVIENGYVLNLEENEAFSLKLRQQLQAKKITLLEKTAGRLVWGFLTQLEEQALQREVFFQALNSTVEGIQIADAQGVEIFINESLLAMTNLKMEDRLGKSVYDVSPDGGMARVLQQKTAVKNIRNHPHGTDVDIISNAGPIYINGNFYGAVTVAYDVTELCRMSRELEENKQKVALLDGKVGRLAPAKYKFADIIGNTPKIQEVLSVARKASAGDLAILIQGESGTGKEIFAHAIHDYSNRSSRPFIPVNCAAIPEQLLESEFFGYEKGAFTSANSRKPGFFDLANTGTLFLDEIGEMNQSLQSKLLRVLQDKEYIRVGGTKSVKADVRIIAATNRNLVDLIKQGKFREDLFYRLNVINIHVPPLRERIDDLEVITNFLIQKICNRLESHIQGISSDALALLKAYSWPGNVRELENVLERAVFLCQGTTIKKSDIRLPEACESKLHRTDNEKMRIINYLEAYGCTVEGKRRTAGMMNMSLATLYNKLKYYKLHDYLRAAKY